MTDHIERWLAEQIGQRLGLSPAAVDREMPLDEYGLSSLDAVGLTGELEAHFGCRIAPTALWDHRTIAALAMHVASLAAASIALPESEADLDALLLELSAKEGAS